MPPFSNRFPTLSQRSICPATILMHGQQFNPKRWTEHSCEATNVVEAIDSLFTVLHDQQIPHLLVGGIAFLLYVSGRNTENIDFILCRRGLDRIIDLEIARIKVIQSVLAITLCQ